jgi:hypothetical protein
MWTRDHAAWCGILHLCGPEILPDAELSIYIDQRSSLVLNSPYVLMRGAAWCLILYMCWPEKQPGAEFSIMLTRVEAWC